MEDEAQATAAGGTHLQHLALPLRHLLHDDAGMLLVHVDEHLLDGLERLTGLLVLLHDTRAGARRRVRSPRGAWSRSGWRAGSFAASGHEEAVLVRRFLDLERDVALGLLEQAVADDAVVTLSPSVPASGLSLTMKLIVTVGGSIGWAFIGSVTSGAQKVSATDPLETPAMATMSPATASSIGWRSMPRKARILETRPCSTTEPSCASTLIGWLA